MPNRPTDQLDVNPALVAADPLLAKIADLVASMDLYIGRHEIKQLTTEQKELWADLVDSYSVNLGNEDPSMLPPGRTSRWWRDEYVLSENPEPDPFLYADEGGTRLRTPASGKGWFNRGAAKVARHALMDVMADPFHEHRRHLTTDFASVYEWAKTSVRPMRMTAGERAGEIGSWASYPSTKDAEAFLAARRAARSASIEGSS